MQGCDVGPALGNILANTLPEHGLLWTSEWPLTEFAFHVWCQLIETLDAVTFSQCGCSTDVPVFIKEQFLSPLAPGAVLPPMCQPWNENSCTKPSQQTPLWIHVWIPIVNANQGAQEKPFGKRKFATWTDN